MLANIKKIIKSISTIERKTERFFSHILVPLWVLTLYFLAFSKLLPEGVNNIFATRSGKYTLWLACALGIVFLAIIVFRKKALSFPLTSEESFSVKNLILLLLPLTPVMQYILNNLEILSFEDIVYILLVFTAFIVFFVLIIPILLRKISSSQILAFLGLAFTFTIINMGALSRQFAWHEVGSLKIQYAIFFGVFLLSSLLFYLNKEKLMYTLIVIFFLSSGFTQILNKSEELFKTTSLETDNKLLSLVDSRKPENMPSIYLLIYDAYVVNETMLAYGIDNQQQEEYLENLGFQIYPHTYSIGAPSISTMSRVLNASDQFYGSGRRAVSGDGVVQNLLKGFGYKTFGVFPTEYFFRGTTSNYDYSYPKYTTAPKDILLQAIFTGEFRFDIGFNKLPREEFLAEKNKLFSTNMDSPKFIYMHTDVPKHSQNSGACFSDETERYNERLLAANSEMNDDIQVILENDPNSIIIIAGDHGGFLTKNCIETSDHYDISEISRLDIQDRFGTFLAIKWPTKEFEQYDDIVVLQDLFPAIFAYIFQDASLLDAKIEPITDQDYLISGAKVIDGIIKGGIDDGEPLFIGANK